MKVVILAGGMGSRLSEETQVKPKPEICRARVGARVIGGAAAALPISTRAHACSFSGHKIELAKDAIRDVIAELEAQANWEGTSD